MGHCKIVAGKDRLRHWDHELLLKALSTLLEENADMGTALDEAIVHF